MNRRTRPTEPRARCCPTNSWANKTTAACKPLNCGMVCYAAAGKWDNYPLRIKGSSDESDCLTGKWAGKLGSKKHKCLLTESKPEESCWQTGTRAWTLQSACLGPSPGPALLPPQLCRDQVIPSCSFLHILLCGWTPVLLCHFTSFVLVTSNQCRLKMLNSLVQKWLTVSCKWHTVMKSILLKGFVLYGSVCRREMVFPEFGTIWGLKRLPGSEWIHQGWDDCQSPGVPVRNLT